MSLACKQKSPVTIWDVNVQNAQVARLGKSHFGIKLLQCEGPATRDFNNNLIVLYARSEEECDVWVKGLQQAAERKLEDYYEILHLIGEGGFAKVRLGRCLATGENRAIKTMNKAEAHTKVVGTEVAIIKRVNHPNIVKTYDIFETSEYIHIVMEYMEGGMLYDSIEDGVKFEEADVVQFMRELLDGVLYLHEMGIVHRDIKPENVLCTSRQTPLHVKIADFGLSSISSVADVKTNRMLMSTMIGTPEFVAPEIARQETYTEKVDMWALGMLCYNVIAGRLPLDESQDMISQIRDGVTLTFPESEWESFSPTARSFIRSLLCSEAEKRLSPLGCLVHPWLSTRFPEKSTRFAAHGRISTFSFAKALSKPTVLKVYDKSSARRQWKQMFVAVNALCRLTRVSGNTSMFEPARLRAMTLRIAKCTDGWLSLSNESESTRAHATEFGQVGFDSCSSLPKIRLPSTASRSAASNSQPPTPVGGASRCNSGVEGAGERREVHFNTCNRLQHLGRTEVGTEKKDERSASVPFPHDKESDLGFGDLDLGEEPEELEPTPRSLGNFPLSFRGLGHEVGLPRLPTLRMKVKAAFGVESAKAEPDSKGFRKVNWLKKNFPGEGEEVGHILSGEPNEEGRLMPDRKPSLRKKIMSSLTRDTTRFGTNSKWTRKWMKKDGGNTEALVLDTPEDLDRALGLDEFSAVRVEETEVDKVDSATARAQLERGKLKFSYSEESLRNGLLKQMRLNKAPGQAPDLDSSFSKLEAAPLNAENGGGFQKAQKRVVKKEVGFKKRVVWDTNQMLDAMSPVTPSEQNRVPFAK